jgi:hypothetical protein
METILAYATNTAVLCVASLVVGVVFGPKIKDFVTGAPAGFRSAMNSIEAKAKADAKAAVADVFAKITPVAAKGVAPAPAAPVAPVVVAAAPPAAPGGAPG